MIAARPPNGPDRQPLLAAAVADPEAGDDLVHHEQRAGAVADGAQALEEARAGRDDAHVARDRLDQDRGQVVAVPLGQGAHGVEVVVLADERVGRHRRRHAGGRGDAERRETGSGLRQQRVGVSVVAARELHDLRAAGVGTGQAHRAHDGLGTRGDEPHLLERRHRRAHLPRQGELELGRGAERRAVPGRRRHRGDDVGVGVAGDQRPPRLHPVDVAVAVRVPDLAAGAPGQEQRVVAPDRPHRPHRAGDAARHEPARLLEEPRRVRLGYDSHSAASAA
jgi:hypothetical protein